MRVISVDIETTGKYANTAHMLSIGYVIEDNKRLTVGEEYFMYDQPIPTSATNVHGITNAILAERSEGLYLADKVEDLRNLFWDPEAIAIGYNCNTFDFRVIDTALMELGLPPHKYREVVDLYAVARKRWRPNPKNPDMPSNLQLDTVYEQCIKEFHSARGFVERRFDKAYSGGAKVHHTAAWDAYMTYHVCKCLCPSLFTTGELK